MAKSKTVRKYNKWNESKIEQLIRLYESGKTLREVGEIYNISRERVRQLFESVSYKPRTLTVSELYKESIKKSGIKRRIVLPKKELERMYLKEKFTINNIARQLKCSFMTVHNNLVRLGIPLRSREEVAKLFNTKHPELTKDVLYQLYIVENKSRAEIGKLSGYSTANIAKLITKYGIRKITGEAYEKHYGKFNRAHDKI